MDQELIAPPPNLERASNSFEFPAVDPGSYRDPSGTVFDDGQSILRSVTDYGIESFEKIWSTGYFERAVCQGWLVPIERMSSPVVDNARALLRHPRLSFISYPYEWSFEALKAAALLHLAIQIDAFKQDIVLSDASAYNVQFQGWRPIFIDHLSFQPYKDGAFWVGHKQFLDQFLNPLLLRAILGVSHNAWYRGALEGIPTAELNRLLPWRKKISLNVLSHVTLPAKFQAGLGAKSSLGKINRARLPRSSYLGMLTRLRSWIEALSPANASSTTWRNYDEFRTYNTEEVEAKRRFVSEFTQSVKPRQLVDIGCNTGEFSEIALKNGAREVIGFDFDQGALSLAYGRSRDLDLRFLPLFLDATNPSPGQGWAGTERKPLTSRCNADALIALAFVHHLAIARNVPLDAALSWLISLAPSGIIEFVPKSDETVKLLLQLRDDIFPNYHEQNFLRIVSSHARIHRIEKITGSGRTLVWYQRGT